MNKARKISNFKECQTNFGTNTIQRKLTFSKTFSFWVNDIFANPALFDICGFFYLNQIFLIVMIFLI